MLQSGSHPAVTAEIMQFPQDFEENQATARMLDGSICYVTMALVSSSLLNTMKYATQECL